MFSTSELQALHRYLLHASLPNEDYGALRSVFAKVDKEVKRREGNQKCKCGCLKQDHRGGRYGCKRCPCATYGANNA